MTAQAADTDITLCAKALLLIGANSISSYSDGNNEAAVASALYSLVYEAELVSFPWAFSTNSVSLGSPLAQTPADKWQYGFTLPTDCIQVQYATVAGTPIDFDVIGGVFLCNYNQSVIVWYTFRAAEGTLTPLFKMALVYRLAAAFCGPFEAERKAAAMNQLAEFWAGKARLKGSQGKSQQSFRTGRLVGERRGGAIGAVRPQDP